MGRRVPKWNQKKLDERIAQGFGSGHGRTYKPWLQFGDIASKGVTSRMWSPRTERVMTLFSNVEKNAFLIAEFCRKFHGYHEQGPMEREITLDICRALGIRHPRYWGTAIPAVLTYDGLLFTCGQRPELIDCKHSATKETPRLQEQYAIRHEYARRKDYAILHVTEQTYPWQLVHNLQWIRMSVLQRGHMGMSEGDIEVCCTRLRDDLAKAVERGCSQPLRDYLRNALSSRGQAPTLGVFALRRLLWEHHVSFNMKVHFLELLHGPVHALCVEPRIAIFQPEWA